MPRLGLALCVVVVLSIALSTPITAASVARTWPVGIEPFGVTIDPRDGKVYVAISDHNNWYGPEYMWAIDPASPTPYEPALPRFQLPRPQIMSVLDLELDRLFVTINDGLAIVDPQTHALIAAIALGGGVGVALDVTSHLVYVTTLNGAAIVDGRTGAVLAQRQAPSTSDAWWQIAHDAARHRVYVANGNYSGAPSLVVLDDTDLSIVATVPLPAIPRLALTLDVTRGLVYVGGFSSGSAPAGTLYAVDAATLQIVATLDVGAGVASPISTTLVAETNRLYVSNIGATFGRDAIVVVDTSTFTVVDRIPLQFQPGQSALHPDGRLYVAGLNARLFAAISLVNSAPSIATLTFAPASPSSASLLQAVAQVSDPDGDPFSVTYEWSRNGEAIADASGLSLDLSLPGHGDRGDVISVRVVASDGRLTTARTASVVVANASPAVALSLSATAPRTNDLIVASASATDPDADAITLRYGWTRNGVAVGVTTPSIDLRQYGDRGDVLVVTVTADDGRGGVTSASATATVADSAPVVTLTTNTSSPKTDQTLVATAAFSDVDGDAVCCAWYFKVNGIVVWHEFSQTGTTSNSFDLSRLGWGDRGDTVTIEAVAGDGTLETLVTLSALVVNSPPLAGVALSDYSPTKRDVLVAYGSVYDADGDSGFLYTYTWRVGHKVKLVVGPTSATTNGFDLRSLQPGDTVSVTVTTTGDGFDPSVAATATAVVVPRP